MMNAMYRFTVGTVSGAVNWVTYLGTAGIGILGIKLLDDNKALLMSARENTEADSRPATGASAVSQAENHVYNKFASVVSASRDNANQAYTNFASKAHSSLTSNVHVKSAVEDVKGVWQSPYVQAARSTAVTLYEPLKSAGTTLYVDGKAQADKAVTLYTGKKIGDFVEEHGVSVARFAIYSWTANKLGVFEISKVFGKQAELQVESLLGVTDDPIGLFDLPTVIAESKAYKYSVATCSKVSYAIGYTSGHVLAGVKYVGIETAALAYAPAITKCLSEYKSYVGAVAVGAVGVALMNGNVVMPTLAFAGSVAIGVLAGSTTTAVVAGLTAPVLVVAAIGVVTSLYSGHEQAHQFGKGAEQWFEHVMGVSGDEVGLLG
jgi:hypothetical protein